jgi:tetratricopeptide (TPR) repeat protein
MGRHREGSLEWQRAQKTLETDIADRIARKRQQTLQALTGYETAKLENGMGDPTNVYTSYYAITKPVFSLWLTLGFAYVKAGLWAEAADCYAQRLNFDALPPLQTGPPPESERLDTALLRLQAGDIIAYRQACKAMQGLLEKSAKPDPLHIWACALDCQAEVDPKQLVHWAEQAVAANSAESPWHVLALACYRAGRLKDALGHADQSNALTNWPGRNVNWPLLAMIHHRLGHTDEAGKWLAKANQEWRKLSPLARAIDSPTALPSGPWYQTTEWHDWLVFQHLLTEANTLILGQRGDADCLDLLHRAYLHTKTGETKKADEEFQAAVNGREKVASAWLARGRVYRLLGDKAHAKADFAKAHELDPKDPEIQKEYEGSK